MNAVEIEEAVSTLAAAPFDPADFPFQFLAAYGMKETTLKRLRTRASNLSDVEAGVLQRNNIHLAIAPPGKVGTTLAALRNSPKTAAAKAKFILATDGTTLEAEDCVSGEPLACDYATLPRHFAVFLPLAGISTVKEIKNNPVDVKATGRLNKLYLELLKHNEDWAAEARRSPSPVHGPPHPLLLRRRHRTPAQQLPPHPHRRPHKRIPAHQHPGSHSR